MHRFFALLFFPLIVLAATDPAPAPPRVIAFEQAWPIPSRTLNVRNFGAAGDVAVGSVWNFGMGLAGMVLGVLGIPVYAVIARRKGKRFAMGCVQVSGVAVFVST